MANPTTNYGWPMPTATDLVTDLPADFAAFGQPVDTSLKALNPATTLGDLQYRSATANTNTRLGIGSTGQVLTVAGGVPSWATPTDQTPLTTKGDVFTFTTVDARLGVGANGTVLTADSAEATGLKWATPAGGGKVLQVVYGMYSTQTLINNTGYTDTGLSLSITPTLNTSKILVMTSNFAYWAESSGNPGMGLQILRGGTAVYEQHPNQNSLAIIVGASGSRGLLGNVVLQYLDSPATTSATTYKTQAKTNCAAYLQWDSGKSNIILMEIGA
jgi:hypothetical protein